MNTQSPLQAARRRAPVAACALLLTVLPTLTLADGPSRPSETPRPSPRIEDFAPPSEFVDAGGIKTHYVVRGDAKGRPIVLVHGFGASTFTWRFNLDVLAAKGFRVYAYDVKGFGLTAKPKDGQYHIVAFSRHLVDFLDALKIERPILVGNSMGGAIVTRVALLHPERVAGIVLVDAAPPHYVMLDRPTSGVVGDLKDAAKEASAKPAGPGLRERLGLRLAKALISRQTVERGLRAAYHNPQKFVTDEVIENYYRPLFIDGAAEALAAITNRPKEPAEPFPPLNTLKPPALIVWGRHDRVIPVATADYFARELPCARKVIFEDSGHVPHEEEADAFNTLLVEFASALPSPSK
jgi:pimeloyl-ACP methyl ester carboxylesterase